MSKEATSFFDRVYEVVRKIPVGRVLLMVQLLFIWVKKDLQEWLAGR